MGRATSKRDDHKDEASETTAHHAPSRPHELVLLDAPHGVFNGPSTVTRVPLDDDRHHDSGHEGKLLTKHVPGR